MALFKCVCVTLIDIDIL